MATNELMYPVKMVQRLHRTAQMDATNFLLKLSLNIPPKSPKKEYERVKAAPARTPYPYPSVMSGYAFLILNY